MGETIVRGRAATFQSMTPAERARSLIDRCLDMTVATVDEAGVPWVSPVFYAPDQSHALYWMSARDARHSANVRARPEVAIVIYEVGPPVDAVYVEAEAVQLDGEDDVRRGIEVIGRRNHLQPDRWRIEGIGDVTGEGPWRIYRAARRSTYVRAATEVGGKPVVTREPADF